MSEYQFDLLSDRKTNEQALKSFEAGLILPVSQLQQKQATETPTLTERELEIMHMTLSGWLIHKVALKLPLSVAGVKWRLSFIYSKFGVKNRLELIEKAVTKGLQFRTISGVLHTFHIRVILRDQQNLTDREVSCD